MREVEKNGCKALILMGLPGSGKTKYALGILEDEIERLEDVYDAHYTTYIELKNELKGEHGRGKLEDLQHVIKVELLGSFKSDLILDGCILTNEELKVAINRALDSTNFELIEIHYWEPNSSLKPKQYKGMGNKGLPQLETVNLEWLKGETGFPNIFLIKHATVEVDKDDYLFFADKHGLALKSNDENGITDRKYLQSDFWLGSSSYYDHGDEGWKVTDPLSKPLSLFVEFDELLMEICPFISFSQYKKLYANTVTIVTQEESDYYTTNEYTFYSCNVEELLKLLVSMGFYDLATL